MDKKPSEVLRHLDPSTDPAEWSMATEQVLDELHDELKSLKEGLSELGEKIWAIQESRKEEREAFRAWKKDVMKAMKSLLKETQRDDEGCEDGCCTTSGMSRSEFEWLQNFLNSQE